MSKILRLKAGFVLKLMELYFIGISKRAPGVGRVVSSGTMETNRLKSRKILGLIFEFGICFLFRTSLK
ncbi:hypothetical protein FHG68_16075 [Leptospira weilii]|nr:hypothetical protein FHG67_16025 [Leptospira weilii]QDK28014.1 hypothetical protein FHG68_16075 [Leptospira weilii]